MRAASALVALGAALAFGCGASAAPAKKRPAPTIVARIRVGAEPTGLALGPGALWAVNWGDGSVARIEPSRNRVTARIDVGGSPYAASYGAPACRGRACP